MTIQQQTWTHRGAFSRLSLIFCLLTGCTQSSDQTISTDDSLSVQPTVTVQVAQAEISTLKPILDLVGVVTAIPEKTAVISPQLGGWVRKLDVVEGQSVKAGELLVELDPRSAEVAVQRAAATVAEKTAALKRLKSGYLPEEIAGARQDAGNAAATVDGLSNELAALKDLLDRNEISSVVYQTKSEALKSAKAALASAEEKVKLLEAGTRPELIEEAQAILDAAKADLEQASLTLQWCTITSPVNGVVVQLLARQGQFFDRAVSLATVMDLSEVFVQIRIPSSQFAKVKQGAKVEVQLTSLPEQIFQGQISRISGQADLATGNVTVFATIQNTNHLLRPGLSCQVQVSLPEVSNVLTIPLTAIADNAGTPVVTIIRDSKAYETEVQLGTKTKDRVEILSGLSAGDKVTTAGGYGLPEGCIVNIVNALSQE